VAGTKALARLTPALLGAALLACGESTPALVVGSKNFTESILLGELAAQQIERRLHVPVTRRLSLGGTLLAHEALVAGKLDLYPEYTGTALTGVLKEAPAGDAAAVFDQVADAYRSRFHLEWLKPLGFDDTFAMVVRGADARAEKLATLSEAARRPRGWALGVGYEFLTRPDGLPGLQKAYALPLREPPRSMDLGLLYRALEDGQVDMVAANATDGLLSVKDFTVLADDKHFFPPYEAAYVARAAALDSVKGLRAALEELSGRLDAKAMRALNQEVDGAHHRPAEVAARFLGTH
jgi:glycine betaine/choline ABC-type transport system substrate-binding protein